MRNNNKQTGLLTLLLVLTVAAVLSLVVLAKKLQDAHIKSINKTISEQFEQTRGVK